MSRDAIFCYACQLFASLHGKSEKVFVLNGFRYWKNATAKNGALFVHNNSTMHRNSMLSMEEFKVNSSHSTSIPHRLETGRLEQIKKNRHYLCSIIHALLFCAHQEISLRGHDEFENSLNRCNFKELVHLLAKYDSEVLERVRNGARNSNYTSPEVQNQLLTVMADMVRKRICNAVQSGGPFSLLADESKDLSNTEQLTVVLRYVDISHGSIHEHFLTFVPAKNFNAESLSIYLLDTLGEYSLDPKQIVSQGYDGAAVMSERCTGVQERIREVATHARYIHCYAHNLNLVLADCVKNNDEASDFFALIQA